MTDYSFHDAVCKEKTPETLLGFLMFGIAVAGKNARSTSNKIRAVVIAWGGGNCEKACACFASSTPEWNKDRLRMLKTGQYEKLEKAYRYLGENKPNLLEISLSELLRIPGVGPKTARYFLMYTREGFESAALDTHVLRFLREFMCLNTPKQTPGNPKLYAELEGHFIKTAKQLGLSPKELDNLVWQYYARGNQELLKHIKPATLIV